MQTQARRQEVERDVPASTVTVAYHMCARTKPDFYTADLVSDLLSGGDSGRLYTHLVKERNLLSSVNAYITGDVDPGLFVFTGQLLPGVTPEAAEAAFREEIEALQTTAATAYEIEKVKNKFEANTLFGELNVMNKAMNLGFYEMLGDLSLINREVDRYRAVTDGGHPLVQPPHAAAPKTVPHSFTTPGNDTTPHNSLAGRGRRSPPHARCPNGIGLYTLASDDFEVLRISFVFRAGSALQQAPFSASAAANLLSEGSRDMTAHQIAEQLDYYGSWYDVNVDRDYAYINFATLSKFFDPTLAVAEQILLCPAFPEEELRTYAAKRRQRLAVERAKIDVKAREAFARALFGERHPYGVSSHEEAYDSLTRDDVAGFYRRALHRRKLLRRVQRAHRRPSS